MPTAFSLELEMKKLEAIELYFQNPDMNVEEAVVKHREALEIAKNIINYLAKAESTIEELNLKDELGDL